jgi:16S rRNA (uracil1498-N3)-methyltransferase
MSHLHRFCVPPEALDAREIELPQDEAHHALRVVRIRPGERVALFDGRGREVEGPVVRADKRGVVVAAETDRREAAPRARLTLLQAWLKRDKHIEEIVRHGTELGVARFVFFRAGHSEKAPKLDPKWDRLAVEACKQCGRLWLPEFSVAADLAQALQEEPDVLLVATRDLPAVPLRDAVRGERVALAIGPEGDFTPDELDLFRRRGGQAISLGDVTLRSEVAAVVGCTLVLYELGLLG